MSRVLNLEKNMMNDKKMDGKMMNHDNMKGNMMNNDKENMMKSMGI